MQLFTTLHISVTHKKINNFQTESLRLFVFSKRDETMFRYTITQANKTHEGATIIDINISQVERNKILCQFTKRIYDLHNIVPFHKGKICSMLQYVILQRKHTLYAIVCNFAPEIYSTQIYVTSQWKYTLSVELYHFTPQTYTLHNSM